MPVEANEEAPLTNLDYNVWDTFTDDGCLYFKKCLECPLSKCILDYEGEDGRDINLAIRDTWKDGVGHPEFFDMYDGRARDIPNWVLDDLGRIPLGHTKAERDANIIRLRQTGLSFEKAAALSRTSIETVRVVLRREEAS